MTTIRRKSVIGPIMAGLAVFTAGPAFASSWADPLAPGSKGQAQAGGLPVAPSGVAAACVSATASKITVTWNSVSRASGYTVFQSTTSATSGYSTAASGVAGTSWTSTALNTGNYWFEVSASIGTNWAGPRSTASGESTVVRNTSCTQP